MEKGEQFINKKIIGVLILLLYLIPLFLQFQFTETNEITGMYIGLPIMQTGDEPHYYATLYSLINDHDLYMTNNYNNAFYNNGDDLGTKKLTPFDRHTRLYNSEEKTVTNIPFADATHLDLSYIPEEDSVIKEIPGHPIGLPLFAFLFLWPLKNTAFLEHAAIFLTLVFSLLSLYYFYKILMYYHTNEQKALLYTLILACATQYWYYTKTFWAEPYLANIVIISWYCILVRRTQWSTFVGALLLGFGFLMKYPFALIIFPFCLWILYQWRGSKEGEQKKSIKNLIFFCIPLGGSVCFVFALNFFLTGTIFGFNQVEAVQFVVPFAGMLRWLLDPSFGLLVFSPVLLLSIFGIARFWRTKQIDALTAGIAIVLYSLFWTSYIVSQYGGGGYAARYLLPITPLLVLFLSFSGVEVSEKRSIRYCFYILLVTSFVINMLAAFAYPAFAGYPLEAAMEKVFYFMRG